MSEDEAKFLVYDWKLWAREKQLSPPGDWDVWLILTGRGWGKNRTGGEWVIDRVKQGFKKIALVGKTKGDVRDTMVEVGDSSILQISPDNFYPQYEPSKRRLTWPNGAIAMFYSGDEPDQLRGPQHDTAWVDELCKFKYPKESWDNLQFGLRIGNKPQICVTTTPRPIPTLKEIMSNNRTVIVRGNTYENKNNLAPTFLAKILKEYEGTRLGRQEVHGEVLSDTPGALWKLSMIENLRIKDCPLLSRVVVAIDPSVTSLETSAEAGIIVAGKGIDDQGYVLADSSIQDTPQVWASMAIKVYYSFKADRIVAEVNNGGEMVELTVHTIDKNVPYKGVHASRGKIARAEPVSALYEQGRIHHVGCFPELEDQMCNWIPGMKSPDRMDALVWALTDLFLSESEPMIFVRGKDDIRAESEIRISGFQAGD